MSSFSSSKPSPHILLVEDSREIRTAMTELLGLEGYEVMSAENGKEALELLKNIHPPKLILLDMQMPVMDGREFLEIYSSDPTLTTIPVYIHSAHEKSLDLKGARGILKKPSSYDAIMELIRKYCGAIEPADP